MLRHYNVALANHFVKDYKLPILITTSEETFEYELSLYEKHYGSMTKWNKLCDAIDTIWNGNVEQFLTTYASARDKIIDTVQNSAEWENFNSTKYLDTIKETMKTYPIPTAKYTKSIYNQEATNKRFISIDLVKANFQALKSVKVIDESLTYAEFMKMMTDVPFLQDYLAESKYIRVATFGKLNPSRTISVERMIMSFACHKVFSWYKGYDIAYFGSDEVVLTVPETATDTEVEVIVGAIAEHLKKVLPDIEFRVESYTLEGYEFFAVKPDGHESKLGEFYHRSCDANHKFKGIPLPYHKVLIRLLNGEVPNDSDKEIMYEKCRVRLLDDIIIKKL